MVQTVTLNTPGEQDGAFTLDVNGVRVIDKEEVFYRDLLWPKAKPKTTKKPTVKPSRTTTARPPPATTTTNDPLGDILGPLLSEIGHLIGRGEGRTKAPLQTRVPASAQDVDGGLEFAEGGWIPDDDMDDLKDDRDKGEDDGDEDREDDDADEDDDEAFSVNANPQREGNSIGLIGIFFR